MKYEFIYGRSAFCLPGGAVDYIAKASQNDLRVLLALGSGKFADEKAIAIYLGISGASVAGSLEFWRGTGILEMQGEKSDAFEQTEISIPKELFAMPKKQAAKAPETERDSYTSEEINRICKENPSVTFLIDACQSILEKTFTKTEISSLVYLSDHLRLEDEYIMMLCTHCKSKEKASVRYVEKVALTLYDEGVVSVKELDKYIKKESQKHEMEHKIRKLFGIGERALAPKEKAFLAKWSTEWCLPFEMIEKAYEIMVGAIEKPTFAYENGILEKWREAGCKTMEDVEGLLASQKKAPKKQETRETSFDLDEFFELAAKRGAGIAGEE
jgi:DnaD/phage-associated family protein